MIFSNHFLFKKKEKQTKNTFDFLSKVVNKLC